jgi:hypothetical protein
VAARAKVRTANALTASADSGADSAPSTSLKAAQFTMTSGLAWSIARLTAAPSAMSRDARVCAITSPSSNARTIIAPSCPAAPVTSTRLEVTA